MAACANCDKSFEKRPDNKGYYRFSLEKTTQSGELAREALSSLASATFTPVSSKRKGQFLCPACWSDLNEAIRYKSSLKDFWSKTQEQTYIGGKRKLDINTSSVTKKPRCTSTPIKKKSVASKTLFSQKSTRTTKWDAIITAVRARQYGRAIRGLYEATKGSKRQFIRIVNKIVRKEVSVLLKPNTDLQLCNEVTIPSIREFSWDKTFKQIELSAPLMFNVVRSVVTKNSNQETLQRGESVNLTPKLGTAIASMLYTKSPQKAAFIPTLFSIQFWRGNLKRETIKQLSKMGICIGYESTLSAVDKVRKDFDATASACKREIEHQLQNEHDRSDRTIIWEEDLELSNYIAETAPNIEDEINDPSDNEDTILYDPADQENVRETLDSDSEISDADEEEVVDEDDDEPDNQIDEDVVPIPEHAAQIDEAIAIEDDNNQLNMSTSAEMETDERTKLIQPGFTLCWDNVGKKVRSRHPGVDSTNKYINMALGYMAINRVPSTHLPWQFDENLKKASEMPHDIFIPNTSDFKNLQSRMKSIVGRIICRHLPWFKQYFSDCSSPHILHEHSAESIHRSILVNLGVFDVDPCSTQGAISIYETLQKYVPSIHAKPYPTAVYGDGLSCERGNDAHRARANGLNPWERLEGCEPAAQEFHKEMLLLQDYFDLFFKGSSAADRGTLCHLKNVFNFRNVKSDISDNFTHAWELMCLTTESFVCLLVMELLNLDDKDSAPTDKTHFGNETLEERTKYFDEVCSLVVQRLWHTLNTNALTVDDGNGPPVFCCGEDFDDDTIACSAGANCQNGEVFHYLCADIDASAPPQNWFCSAECRTKISNYAYCHCRVDLGEDEPMIGCAASDACCGREWYHMKCVQLSTDSIPEGDWFCSDNCRNAKKPVRQRKRKGKKSSTVNDKSSIVDDFKYNYARAITWIGLNLLCRRDAVREADGEAMMTHWRMDLIHFFRSKHPKYLILAHRLMVSINGWLPEKLKNDLVHNRTVNYGGGIGRNLPMDFMNEILNRLFKDLLESAKGRYTNTTIQRCSQIIGPLGEALDIVFDSKVVENELYRHRRRDENRDKNVEQMINFLKDDDIFRFVPGRFFRAFPDFRFTENPKQAGQFKAKMNQLSKKLDKRRRIVINEI